MRKNVKPGCFAKMQKRPGCFSSVIVAGSNQGCGKKSCISVNCYRDVKILGMEEMDAKIKNKLAKNDASKILEKVLKKNIGHDIDI